MLRSQLLGWLAIVAVVFSALAGAAAVWPQLGSGTDLVFSGLALLIAFLSGAYAARISALVRQVRREKRVFLACPHTVESKAAAEGMAEALRQHRMSVWIARERVRAGENWQDAIKRAIEASDACVALIPETCGPNLLYEIAYAQANGVRVVPVLLGEATLPHDLAGLQTITIGEELDQGVKKVLSAIGYAGRIDDPPSVLR